jgi:hypothetical protein
MEILTKIYDWIKERIKSMFNWITDIDGDGIFEYHKVPKDGGVVATTSGGGLLSSVGGLCVWLDGELNSRSGMRDENVNGMENLSYEPLLTKSTVSGCREVLSGTPTFGEKSCKLGGTMFVPCYEQDKMSFEFVGDFTTNNFNNIISQQLFTNSIYKGGYQVFLTNVALHYQLFNASNQIVKQYSLGIQVEPGKKYHLAVTDDFTATGVTKFYVDGSEVTPEVVKDQTGGCCTQTVTNIGIMGVQSPSCTSVYPVANNGEGCFYGEYTNINSFRLWNRVLTPEEIKKNYSIDKRRFG